jgi:uncharacterized membrane protein
MSGTTSGMVATSETPGHPALHGIYASQDLAIPPEPAFALLCEVEKWPVWMSFLKSARRTEPAAPLRLGSEILLRSAIPSEEEQLYEVDQLIQNHMLALIGAYSIRRKLDIRIERKSDRSRIVARVDYPSYGGALGALIDRFTIRRKLTLALEDSLLHFKGLVEYERHPHAVLEDF